MKYQPVHQMQCVLTTSVGRYRARRVGPNWTFEADYMLRLSPTQHLPHDQHNGRETALLLKYITRPFCQNAVSNHLLYIFCYVLKMYSCDLFFAPIRTILQKCWCFCIPCHSKSCDPWQTPCGAGVETQGSSPLLHWSLPYCPCPHACHAPSLLLPSWCRQENLSTITKWDHRDRKDYMLHSFKEYFCVLKTKQNAEKSYKCTYIKVFLNHCFKMDSCFQVGTI